MTALPPGWTEIQIGGLPVWRHSSGAQVYQSSFWKKAEEERQAGLSVTDSSYFYFDKNNNAVVPEGPIPTWKAQRVRDVPDGDDDGYIYPTMEEAMDAAIQGSKRRLRMAKG